MKKTNFKYRVIALLITLLFFLISPLPSSAINNPELLPNIETPVIDLARTLSDKQKAKLEQSLIEYENKTGWKIRVLSQFESTPGLAVKEYWKLDERSLLLIADPRGGNLLNFNVGDAYFALMPRLFWVELQTRYGNQYFVKDNGEDGSILNAISAVENCLDIGGCQVVPGLPKEQSIWSLATSLLGGLIAGIASYPRNKNQTIAWGWLMLLSPLWIMLFGIFGLAPIFTRTSDLIPIFRNTIGFIVSACLAYFAAEKSIGKNDLA